MDAEIKLTLLIISLMERALEEIAKNQELRSSILEGAQNIDDWLQEKRGKINRRTTVESITLAINTSVVRDKNTICSIIAVITTLYATRKITRGAHVGGTLRKFFGENVFPHIDEKELRFAKPVNEKVYEHILESVSDSFLDVMKQYDFKKYADFSNVNSGYGTWAATAYIGVHGLAKAILDFGSGTLKNLKELIELKRA